MGAEIIKPACVALPVRSDMIGADGTIADHTVRDQLADVWSAILRHLEDRPASL